MTEHWKDVVGFVGRYQVSDLGRVRSLDRAVHYKNGKTRTHTGQLLRQGKDTKGRPQVVLTNKTIRRSVRVSALVAEAFLGPRPSGLVTCHNDGDHNNNTATNLRYDTQVENIKDKLFHGTQLRGHAHGRAILTETDVKAIRASRGLSQSELARRYGVSKSAIADILHRRNWQHIP